MGQIPKEICNAVALAGVGLDNNLLSGSIEDTFVKCGNLTQLVLVRNQIGGMIPEYLSELPLMILDIDSNNFTGAIPKSLWNSTNLMEFSAAHNLKEGTLITCGDWYIPSKLSKYFHQVNIPDFSFDQHHGIYDLSYNRLLGPIPVKLGSCLVVVDLLLGNNMLSGEIHVSLSRLMNLTTLDLSENFLSGGVPPQFGCSVKL
ncbi:hypothetical protein Vadar_034276 [Vaccinium darrowii]|uniref:Uncharacterized protein n=1 Tax=Vaccinium darrowii TaxID=229202 RepID=A0ACB7XW37_9ERIC|nr:hypothetical protein Vadar_034276 [Vaccinium darrowii]